MNPADNPTPPDSPHPPEQASHPASEPETTPCWRCGKPGNAGRLSCAWCQASLVSRATAQADRAGAPIAAFFPKLMAGFGLFIAISAGNIMIDSACRDATIRLACDTAAMALVGAVTTWLCLVRPPIAGFPVPGLAWLAWVAAVPILAACIQANFMFHDYLKKILTVDAEDGLDLKPWQAAWLFILLTIFPAIIEEVFFRHLVLDTFRREFHSWATGVWVSSIMFGMAHIGQPFALPYLIGIGFILALLRTASGTLLLPMLVHAFHNGIVVARALDGKLIP